LSPAAQPAALSLGETLAVVTGTMLELPRRVRSDPSRAKRSAPPPGARRLYNDLGAPQADRDALERAIALLEREPLASAGVFPGDLLRRLIDLPSGAWARHGDLYPRFREIVRMAALARRELPEELRGAFWSALPDRVDER
jgi:hypothetical protein